ncbi:MAG: YcxB family protein [Candidatus Omnitrophica bacterium]|nr:YcxB family protein [Candidatus Omnitrophota bacterium]
MKKYWYLHLLWFGGVIIWGQYYRNFDVATFYGTIFMVFIAIEVTQLGFKVRKGRGVLAPREYELTSTGIHIVDDITEFHFRWSAVSDVIEGRDRIFLVVDSGRAIVFPKRHFSSESEINEFKNLVERECASL